MVILLAFHRQADHRTTVKTTTRTTVKAPTWNGWLLVGLSYFYGAPALTLTGTVIRKIYLFGPRECFLTPQ